MPNFSKLAAATTALFLCNAPTTTYGHKLRLKVKQPETCSANLERLFAPANTEAFSEYSGSGQMFEDPTFPAGQSSLYWADLSPDAEMQTTYDSKVTGWARPSQLVKDGSPSLWGSQGVKPAGVNQGSLGDCWFMASAAAIAETPERIMKIFTNQDYSAEGIFQVTLYHMGKPVKEVVDDRIPIEEGKDPAYTNYGVKTPVNANVSPNGAWWQVILEKAYAKYNLNYSNLNGGLPGVALRELTGMPVVSGDVTKETPEEFYAKIKDADRKNYVMVAGCSNPHANLVTGHAYTLLGIQELKQDGEVVYQLIKLRNPWGKEQYDGPWKDSDPQWTDDFKEQAGLTIADDGIFHIPLDDFKQAFTTYDILMYQDWSVSQQKIQGTGKNFKTSFTSDVDQDIIITQDYQNSRQVGPGCAMPSVQYNMYVDNGEPVDVSSQTGYGSYKMSVTAGKKHTLEVINWGDTTVESDFILGIYAADSEVPIVKE